MRLLGGLALGVALLALAGCGPAPGGRHAPPAAPAQPPPFERPLPDTSAGAALQARLGDPSLAEADKRIEREAFELVARDGDALVEGHIGQHGRTVNTDDARELFAAYRADRSRAAAVHRPATELAERVYAKLLETERGRVTDVLFLAGGAGSGKTTALRRMGLDLPIIAFDGTFADLRSDLRRIGQALARGYAVRVVYVHVEDPLEALGHALDRAELMAAGQGSGRTVPTTRLVEQHAAAREAFVEAAEALAGDPRVSFQLVDNSGAAGGAAPTLGGAEAVAFMRGRLYGDAEVDRLKREARRVVEERFRAGRISPRTYRGFAGGA